MSAPSVIHDTFVIERTYSKAPETVFAALADPAKKRRWFAEGEMHTVEAFAMDFQVGGVEHAHYRFNAGTPFPGVELKHEATYQDIVENRRVVTAGTMSFGGRRISASLVTIELLPDGSGTKLICTHQGAFFEGADGPKIREQGFQKLLDQLAKEVSA
jgi:uncharacterized protein YndB with AHSA1/START domain